MTVSENRDWTYWAGRCCSHATRDELAERAIAMLKDSDGPVTVSMGDCFIEAYRDELDTIHVRDLRPVRRLYIYAQESTDD